MLMQFSVILQNFWIRYLPPFSVVDPWVRYLVNFPFDKKRYIDRIYDGFGAKTRKSRASFEIIQVSSSENEPEISLPRLQHHH